ncbi:MAG: glutathione S-transferase N-terminal domain-containing protein [Myxococcaceae bacterium]
MALKLIGRSSSHFTRVTQIFALELGVDYRLAPIFDITSTDSAIFSGNPALKIPTLDRDGVLLFGAENICRKLAELAPAPKRLVWPEQLTSELSRNAHELLLHSMAAQVQLAIGVHVSKLPADNVFFTKIRAGFEGALGWLDANLDAALAAMPPHDLSFFEVALFCLVEHLPFRATLPVEPYPNLVRFSRAFGECDSAKRTAYKFDQAPS